MNNFFRLAINVGPGVLAIAGAIYAAVLWRKFSHNQKCWWMFGIMTSLLTWSFMNSMEKVADAWKDAQYSHGYLIPAFAAVLLFVRRKDFTQYVPTWQQAMGFGIIAVAMLIRIYASQRAIMTVDRIMLLPALMGVMLIVGGVGSLKWSAAPIGFLVFMYPFPRRLEQGLLIPLQGLATKISHYALETLGVECYTEGNRIMLDGMEMGIVDACSGLRMLTIFFALSTAIAMISTNRPWWERLVIIVSALPIALTVNSIRITLTGLAFNLLGNEGEVIRIINTVAHDSAGWIMMPMALGFLYLEYQILANLIIEDAPKQFSPIAAR